MTTFYEFFGEELATMMDRRFQVICCADVCVCVCVCV
uniref:Uncharacterized protein n=1 Tax=viral metagenome TaxID=1070528 RepID=A0A6C0BPI7_9ZZZZ